MPGMQLTLSISRKETFKMGLWGHRSFENDDALDWTAELDKKEQSVNAPSGYKKYAILVKTY
jgi:hypothetical protein